MRQQPPPRACSQRKQRRRADGAGPNGDPCPQRQHHHRQCRRRRCHQHKIDHQAPQAVQHTAGQHSAPAGCRDNGQNPVFIWCHCDVPLTLVLPLLPRSGALACAAAARSTLATSFFVAAFFCVLPVSTVFFSWQCLIPTKKLIRSHF